MRCVGGAARHAGGSYAGAGTTRSAARALRAAAVVVALTGLAACTSGGGRTTGSSRPSASPTSGPGTVTSNYAAAVGVLLVAGPTADRADVYRVGATGLTRVTTSADVTGVAADRSRVAVAVRPSGGDETVRGLTGATTVDLGIASGFDPDLSTAGLLYAAVDTGAATGGVTKPKGFSVEVRTDLRAASRTVYDTPASVGAPRWIGAHALVVAVGSGNDAQVLRVDTATGAAAAVTTVVGASDLALVADATTAAVGTDAGGVLVTLADRRQHPMPSGWSPLCWLHPGSLLATNDGRLATIAVATSGAAATPVVLGALPGGTTAYAATCGRVG